LPTHPARRTEGEAGRRRARRCGSLPRGDPDLIATGRPIYAVNTGFGKLAAVRIEQDQLEKLQQNLILSHSADTGELLSDYSMVSPPPFFQGIRRYVVSRRMRISRRSGA
jgi:hypothetical protein